LIDVKNQFSKSLFKIRGTIVILTIVLAIISIIGYIIWTWELNLKDQV